MSKITLGNWIVYHTDNKDEMLCTTCKIYLADLINFEKGNASFLKVFDTDFRIVKYINVDTIYTINQSDEVNSCY